MKPAGQLLRLAVIGLKLKLLLTLLVFAIRQIWRWLSLGRVPFQRGGTILAITGNHDKDAKINAVHAGMTLAMPFAMQGGNLGGGRMYLLNGRGVATLAAPDGQRVQFVFVPYPFPSRYDAPRGYFVLAGSKSSGRAEVRQFIAWLVEEARSAPET